MINPFYEKLANLAVNYSLNVKKGDRVYIVGPNFTQELLQALHVEVIKAGAHSFVRPLMEGGAEILLKFGTEDQLTYVDEVVFKVYKEFDCFIQILADYNTRKFSLVDPAIMGKWRAAPKRRELAEIMSERHASGELKWVVVPYPCQSHAQEANMDLFSFSKYVEKALLLDKEDPAREWTQIDKEQEKIVKILNKVEHIKVIGEDTDLEFSVKGRTWENCSGENNLPDGEVFTGPVEDSVNGKIRFTFPGIYSGREVKNIYLEFKEGKVIKATADQGEDLLKVILKIENADIIGEFAIGTNYGVTTFIKNMLFDEKMGGTIHCALGLGLPETGSKNVSAIHWDILKDMKQPGSKILADNKVIYEEGNWKI